MNVSEAVASKRKRRVSGFAKCQPVSLGYHLTMAGEIRADQENDAIVANYFAMLHDDISGSPYSKAEHNRQLQSLIGRGRRSIEFKHRQARVQFPDVIGGCGSALDFGSTGMVCPCSHP